VRRANRLDREYRDEKSTIEEFLTIGFTVQTLISGMVFLPDHIIADPMTREGEMPF
jgi:hypothetical protein